MWVFHPLPQRNVGFGPKFRGTDGKPALAVKNRIGCLRDSPSLSNIDDWSRDIRERNHFLDLREFPVRLGAGFRLTNFSNCGPIRMLDKAPINLLEENPVRP